MVLTAQPWIGPDPYTENLQHLFFGRPDEIEELWRLVLRERLSVLFGASGLGKTSLLRAGLFPKLRSDGYLPVYVRLDHTETAPRLGEQVLSVLEEAAKAAGIERPPPHEGDLLWQHFHREGERYWTSDHRVVTPVIVFDQLEEIFTRGQESPARIQRGRDFIQELADLIEDRQPREVREELDRTGADVIEAGYSVEPAPLKVLVSLREDFLPHLEQLRRVLPAIGRNRMRLTLLKVERAKDVVEGPVRDLDLLEPGVTQKIIQIISGSENRRSGLTAVAVPSSLAPTDATESDLVEIDPALLSIFCFELNLRRIAAEKDKLSLDLLHVMRESIIQGFYDRAFEGLPQEVQAFVEDHLVSPTGYRDSRTVDEALMRPGVTSAALDRLVEKRLLQYEERTNSPRRVELKHDVFVAVAVRSRGARVERRRRRIRRAAGWVLGAGAVVLVVVSVTLSYLYVWEHTECFDRFVMVWGEPRGVRPLTAADVSHRPVSLKLVRRGRLGHVLRILAVGPDGSPTPDHNVVTYLSTRDLSESKRLTTVEWRFVYDDRETLVYESAFSREGKSVWTFVLAPPTVDPKTHEEVRVGQFIGEGGLPAAKLRGFVELRSDGETGFETGIRYLDAGRHPIPGQDNAYGKRRTFDAVAGLLSADTSLDEAGRPMNDEAGNASAECTYDGRGDLVACHAIDADRKTTHMKDGYVQARYDRDAFGNIVVVEYEGADGKPQRTRDGYSRMTRKLDAAGRVILKMYYDDNNPTHDTHGCFGYTIERNPTGIERLTCINEKQHPITNDDGYATIVTKFDGWGDVRELATFDGAGKAAIRDGYHRQTFQRDDRGRVTANAYYLPDGSPAVYRGSSPSGYASVESDYAADGAQKRLRYYDGRHAPVMVAQGYSEERLTYDDAGRLSGATYFGVDGRPVLCKENYAGFRISYDIRGYEQERSYLGIDGTPTVSEDGYARERMTRDSVGHLVRVEYLDANGAPTNSSDGVAGEKYEVDPWGNRTRMTYFNASGEPMRGTKRYAGWRAAFDALGRQLRVDFLDESGAPTNAKGGHSTRLDKYDPWSHVVEERFLGTNDRLVTDAESGYAIYRATYNRQGKQTSASYFDYQGQPTKPETETGCSTLEYDVDERGYTLANHCKDIRGKAARSKDGWVSARFVLDEFGQATESAYFDLDEFGQPTESANLDANEETANIAMSSTNRLPVARGTLPERPDRGEPLDIVLGYHRVVREYDPYGHVVRIRFFDRSGKPTTSSAGFAELRKAYTRNVASEQSFFVAGLKVASKDGFHRETREIDASGRVTLLTYFGTDDKVMVTREGYAAIRKEYDTKSRPWRSTYLDAKGQPTSSSLGYATVETFYDDSGRPMDERYLDRRGAPVNARSGCARVTTEIGADAGGSHGTVERQSCYAADGQLAWGRFGTSRYAVRVSVKNQAGRLKKETFMGPILEPAVQPDRCSLWEYAYDEWGNQTEAVCFSAPGIPATAADGFHRLLVRFNEQRQPLSWATYGVDAKLTMNKRGYARITLEYDDLGNDKREEYFNANDKLINVIEYKYDGHGNQTGERVIDSSSNSELFELRRTFDDNRSELTAARYRNGAKSVFPGTAAHEIRHEYDTFGREVRQTYYDVDGRPTPGVSPSRQLCGEWIVAYDGEDRPKGECRAAVPKAP